MRMILFLFFFSMVHAEIAEILAWNTEEILIEGCLEKLKNNYQLRIVDEKNNLPLTTDPTKLKRCLVLGVNPSTDILSVLPAEKKVLFMLEPCELGARDAQYFSRIYTWDDNAIDGKKIFKFYFPTLKPMIQNLIPFEERKLCTMIVRNWNAPHRHSIVEFFANQPKGEFEFYGSPFPKFKLNKMYKGRIPGLNFGEEKIDTLKNYRFCICFENSTHLKGYITEKIFPCFAAGSIPIYWGAPNIEEYIPKDCFIDYRNFQSNEELYLHLKEMPKAVYEQYLEQIRAFLSSESAKKFSPEYFAQTLLEAVTQ